MPADFPTMAPAGRPDCGPVHLRPRGERRARPYSAHPPHTVSADIGTNTGSNIGVTHCADAHSLGIGTAHDRDG